MKYLPLIILGLGVLIFFIGNQSFGGLGRESTQTAVLITLIAIFLQLYIKE